MLPLLASGIKILCAGFIANHFNIGRGVKTHIGEIEATNQETKHHANKGYTVLAQHIGRQGFFSPQRAPKLDCYDNMLFTIAKEQEHLTACTTLWWILLRHVNILP